MARAALPNDLKRKQVAVRLGPRDRERISALAEANGNSLGSEVEQLALDQLEYLEGVDAPTRELLTAILNEVSAIQKVTGKRWHKDRATWSAVKEMLRLGPVVDLDPDNPRDDEAATQAWSELWEIEQKKKALAARLRELGVSVSWDNPKKAPARRMGLFGSARYVNALAAFSIRSTERAGIDALPDGLVKEEAIQLFEQLKALDSEEDAADAAWIETLKPFWDAVGKGRDLYRDMLKKRAERLREEGKDYNVQHLTGWFANGS